MPTYQKAKTDPKSAEQASVKQRLSLQFLKKKTIKANAKVNKSYEYDTTFSGIVLVTSSDIVV